MWIPIISSLLIAFGIKRIMDSSKKDSLELHGGRRKAAEKTKRKPEFYESNNVVAFEEFVYNSRGIEIFTKRWLPVKEKIKALVFYCHGYGDCCSYFFEDVAVRLAAASFGVFALDYEGFGQSQGLHCYIQDFNIIINDVTEFVDSIKKRQEYSNLPCFLYGESMGGAVVIKTHFKQPHAWNGAILLAPMCKISEEMMPPPIVVRILKSLGPIFPKWKIVPSQDIGDKAFRVKEKRELARKNPTYYLSNPRLQTALQLLHVTNEISDNLSKVNLPLLILHGGSDTVTDPSASVALYEASSHTDKTLNVYDDSWHALTCGEPDDVVEKVFGDILNWLNQRVGVTN